MIIATSLAKGAAVYEGLEIMREGISFRSSLSLGFRLEKQS